MCRVEGGLPRNEVSHLVISSRRLKHALQVVLIPALKQRRTCRGEITVGFRSMTEDDADGNSLRIVGDALPHGLLRKF